jgi:hypothetical protein
MTDGTGWFPSAELGRVLPNTVVDALRQTKINAETKALDKSYEVRSDGAGVFAANTTDLDVQFFYNNREVATRTIHGVLNTTTGEFTLSSTAFTGELTVVDYYGTTSSNVGDSVRADVTHVKSKKTGFASFVAKDMSVGGSTPSVITDGGGGGDFPPGGGGGGSK